VIHSEQYHTIGDRVGSSSTLNWNQNHMIGMDLSRCIKRMLKINKLYEEVHSKNAITKVN